MEEAVFQEPLFEQEGREFWGPYSAGQQNRYPMMKSFYMAMDYINNSYQRTEEYPQGNTDVDPDQMKRAINQSVFTIAAEQGGILDDLKSYEQGNKEENMISKWLDNVNSDLEKESMQSNRNTEIAEKWYQMLTLVDE